MTTTPPLPFDPRTVGSTWIHARDLRDTDVIRFDWAWRSVEHVFTPETTDEEIAKFYKDSDSDYALLNSELFERHDRVVIAIVNDKQSRPHDITWTLVPLHGLERVEVEVRAAGPDTTPAEGGPWRRSWSTAHVAAGDVCDDDTALIDGLWREIADVWNVATIDLAVDDFDAEVVAQWRRYLDVHDQYVIIRYYVEQVGEEPTDRWVALRRPELVTVRVPAGPVPVPVLGQPPYHA